MYMLPFYRYTYEGISINLMEKRDKEKYFYMMKNESHVIFFPNYSLESCFCSYIYV